MRRRTFVGTGLSAAFSVMVPDMRLLGIGVPRPSWQIFGQDPKYDSVVEPPGYEVPGMTTRYVVPTWQSEASVRERTKSLVGMIGENVAGLALDRLLRAAVEAKLGDVLPLVADRITPGRTGYLLRINLVREPTGRLYPAPNLITAIGLGVEPLEALAEFRLLSSIGPPPPPGVKEYHYRWCTRSGDELRASCVSVELGSHLEARAEFEALRRRTLGGTSAERQAEELRRLDRGREFMAQWGRRQAQIRTEHERARLDALVRSFTASEQRFDTAYAQYQRAERKAAEHAREAAFLSALSGVLGAANFALQRHRQLRGQADGSPEEQARWNTHREGVMRRASETARADMGAAWPTVERLDARLRSEWERLGEAPMAPLTRPIY